jgi:hypothetical protein
MAKPSDIPEDESPDEPGAANKQPDWMPESASVIIGGPGTTGRNITVSNATSIGTDQAVVVQGEDLKRIDIGDVHHQARDRQAEPDGTARTGAWAAVVGAGTSLLTFIRSLF